MKTKQLFITLTAVALCLSGILFISGCKKDNKPGVESLKFDAAAKTVPVGDSVTLTVTITPEDAEYKDVLTVSSKAENVASAKLSDKTVIVKGLNPGKSTVTVTANSLSASIEITVEPYTVKLDVTDTTIGIGDSFLLSATVSPKECATAKWTSKDVKIATVMDGGFSGMVVGAGEGETYVYCTVNDRVKDSCKVTVRPVYPEAPKLKCVKIGNTVWAPVNCGYDATNYKYGKLYQWGRKNGCGYKADDETGTYNDAGGILQTTSSTQGTVSADKEDSTIFYIIEDEMPRDWLKPQDSTRWNGNKEWPAKETSPLKTKYDPCPDGWRVPTYAELNALIGNADEKGITSSDGWDATNMGYWFNGTKKPVKGEGLFLPAAGLRNYRTGKASSRSIYGNYWSSSSFRDEDKEGYARLFGFDKKTAGTSFHQRASGYSVRCVQE